jgi:hypothetical protein
MNDFWIATGVALGVSVIAGLADRRRNNRTNLEAVGFMPWPMILILSLILAGLFATLALKAG